MSASSFFASRFLSRGLAALSFAGLAAALTPAVLAQSYSLTLLGGTGSVGYGVNDSGQVAGEGSSGAFLFDPTSGVLKNLGTLPGGTIALVQGINDSGQVVGYGNAAGGDNYHPFLSGVNGGALKDLGTPSGTDSVANGVNASGQVTGYSGADSSSGGDAFLSGPNGGALKDLGTLPGATFSDGNGVNASGQVTGAGGNGHAFLSGASGGTLKDLGLLPGGTYSDGIAVDASGQVAGNANTASGSSDGFLSGPNGGPLIDIGTLPGATYTFVKGMNDAGQVVGQSYAGTTSASDSESAFLYSNGEMINLNSLIAPSSGFTLAGAFGISDTGFITGYGFTGGGQGEAFLLTPLANPVPEASTTVSLGLLLALGMGGLVVARRKTLAA